MTIFANVVAKLPTEFQATMNDQLVRKLTDKLVIKQNTVALGTALLNIIDSQLEVQDMKNAKVSLENFKHFYQHTDNYLLRGRYHYFTGIFKILTGEIELGQRTAQTAINRLELFGNPELSVVHERYLQEVLNNTHQ
ncbi:hypothetical protein EQG49_05425 [Periweissella cryptocerci]|uniref:HTH-type transcriptional regulator Rgg C-terminal domain-containing protein n=1 Tax=Periweissella cryptocerci TaxID=2506420 RepID=A0A4P6YT63_9LACO|nr:hypothetical protein EQG49_05425 [Periweissella cryptocerci]